MRAPELPPSVATFLADALEEQVLSGRLAPGTPLLQHELAASFGVSRLPVRDALAILEQRHLAVRLPRRGVIVRPVAAEDVRDVFAAWRHLEGEIVRLAAARVAPADLEALARTIARQRAATELGDLAAVRGSDRAFHGTVWRASGSAVYEDLVRLLWRRTQQARAFGHRDANWGSRSVARHERLLNGLRSGDPAAAARAAVSAITESEAEILDQIAARRGASSPPASHPAAPAPAAARRNEAPT